jgi:hypothetical protein
MQPSKSVLRLSPILEYEKKKRKTDVEKSQVFPL